MLRIPGSYPSKSMLTWGTVEEHTATMGHKLCKILQLWTHSNPKNCASYRTASQWHLEHFGAASQDRHSWFKTCKIHVRSILMEFPPLESWWLIECFQFIRHNMIDLYNLYNFPTPRKNISRLGWLFPIYGKKHMFQTTNQKMSEV